MPEESTPVKAELLVDGASFEVGLRLSGRFQPIDGRFHWGGRMSAGPPVLALLRAGRRSVHLQANGDAVPARLVEADPWGGIRVTGTGTPPYPVDA